MSKKITYKTVKVKLKYILKDKINYTALYDVIGRTNNITILCYFFIRLYIAYLYKSDKDIPNIEKDFIIMAFKALSKNSCGKLPSGKNLIDYTDLCVFYKETFIKLLPNYNPIDDNDIINADNIRIITDKKKPAKQKLSAEEIAAKQIAIKTGKDKERANKKPTRQKLSNEEIAAKQIVVKIAKDKQRANKKLDEYKFDASNLSYVLADSAIEMATVINNNIKFHFLDHLKLFVNVQFKEETEKLKDLKGKEYADAKKKLYNELYKLKTDLFNNTKTCDKKYHKWLDTNRPYILPKDYVLSHEHNIDINPGKYLKHMIYMAHELEKSGAKSLQVFPIRTQTAPKYININSHALVDILMNKANESVKKGKKTKMETFDTIRANKNNIWDTYFHKRIFKIKLKGCQFDYQIQTDGIGASLTFVGNEQQIKQDKKKDAFTKGIKNTNNMKKIKDEKEMEKIKQDKKDALKEKNDKKKLGERDNKKKHKESFKKLSKEEKEQILHNNALKVEFPYIEKLVKSDIRRKEIEELMEKKLIVVGDPGKRSPLYLKGTNGEYFNYTNRSRLSATKRLKYAKLIKNKKEKELINGKSIKEYESTLTNLNSKAWIITNLEAYIKEKLKVNQIISKSSIDKYCGKLKWFGFINKQKHEAKLIENLTKKYTKDAVFIIGDWRDNGRLKFMSTPGIGLRRKIAEHFKVYLIDEYMTSKLHHIHEVKCENLSYKYTKETEGVKEIKSQHVHAVLIYKLESKESGCINRDKNSVNNMEKIVKELVETQERPLKYRRSKPKELKDPKVEVGPNLDEATNPIGDLGNKISVHIGNLLKQVLVNVINSKLFKQTVIDIISAKVKLALN
jgi:hypothetical protein